MIKISKIWSIIGALFVVALISSALLTLVYNITKEPIKEAQNRLISNGIKEVIVTDFDNDPFAEKIIVRRGKERYTLYPARNKGYVTSIVMKSLSNNGFGGLWWGTLIKIDYMMAKLLNLLGCKIKIM